MIKKLIGNSASIIFVRFFDSGISFVTTILLMHYFNYSGFAKLSILGMLFYAINILDNLWITPIMLREIALNNDVNIVVGNSIIIRFLTSIIIFIFFLIILYLVDMPREILYLTFVSLIFCIMQSFFISYSTVINSQLKFRLYIIPNILCKLLVLLILFFVIRYKYSLPCYYILSVLPTFILLLHVKHLSTSIIKPIFKFSIQMWRKLFSESLPLLFSAIFIIIYHRIDHILIYKYIGMKNVGIYSLSTKMVEIFHVVPMAVMTSLFPILSNIHKRNYRLFMKCYNVIIKYFCFLVIPIVLFLHINSDYFFMLIFGDKYMASSFVFKILILSEIFVSLGIVNNALLIISFRQYYDPIFTGATAIINILLNILLIPIFGLLGAAYTTLFSYGTGPILGLFFSKTREFSICLLKNTFHSLLVSCPILLFSVMGSNLKLLCSSIYIICAFIICHYLDLFNSGDIFVFKKLVHYE